MGKTHDIYLRLAPPRKKVTVQYTAELVEDQVFADFAEDSTLIGVEVLGVWWFWETSWMLHRDDIPMDVFAEMEKRLRAKFGANVKIVCPGDMPEGTVPGGVEACVNQLNSHFARTFAAGRCAICGAQIPMPWPPDSESVPVGWEVCHPFGDGVPYLECPDCGEGDDEDED